MDDDAKNQPTSHVVGMVLDAMSVEELEARIQLLEVEITRLKTAIEARDATRKAADSVFKF